MPTSEISSITDTEYEKLLNTHPKIDGAKLEIGKKYWVFGDPFMRKYQDPILFTFKRRDESGVGNTNKNVYGEDGTKYSYTRDNMTFYEQNETNDEWVKKLTEMKGGKSRKSKKSKKSRKSKK